uniref:Leucine-rich repeat-containing N-terminal plant-type domain-containing protein n=1 Tax=Manihot esculenta TaxID=3983 RepID=A0A199UBX3_MANES
MELANIAKCLLLGVVILWIQIHGNKGCFEEERLALLDFKAFVGSNGFDADHLLPSWIDDPTSNCCKWERVMCNSTTGCERLSKLKKLEVLDLARNRFNNNILSLLSALMSLKTLILRDNRMEGSFPMQGMFDL